jgi:S1-C subfamily serine protease
LVLGAIAVGISLVALLVAVVAVLLPSGVTPALQQSRATAGEGVSSGEGAPVAAGDPLFEEPQDVTELIRTVKGSLVLVQCGEGSGTGWIIDTAAEPLMRAGRDREFDSDESALVVTADHVIRDCVKDASALSAVVGEIPVDVVLLNWHKREDIALLAINMDRRGLPATTLVPQGSWAMSVGYPYEFDFPVPLMGRVIDHYGPVQYVDMTIQPGNSGSPIVNSKGAVVGTAVASLEDPASELSIGWTVSVTTETLCQKLFDCGANSITASRSDE